MCLVVEDVSEQSVAEGTTFESSEQQVSRTTRTLTHECVN